MIQHVFLPEVPLQAGFIHPVHEEYLKGWRERAIQCADNGDVASSMAYQASLIDLVLFGRARHDWLGVMDEFLTQDGVPQAYSEIFGRRLWKFGGQYQQSTIHAIHTRWWLESLSKHEALDHGRFADLLQAKRQIDGLIYDRDVSETTLRHRMKSELTMSMAMSVEIFLAAGRLTGDASTELATNIADPKKCPLLGYMSTEYFRLKALELLGHDELFPVGIEEPIHSCTQDLPVGWCDFSMKSKVDAYMGTAKRTARDKPIHSPLIACHVAYLLKKVKDAERRAALAQRLADYACHLKKNPLDIPGFQMRDVPIPFGADKTPLEVICASFLITQCRTN